MIDLRLFLAPTASALLSAHAAAQGGDTIAQATVIGSLPHSSTGTTAGFNDDYDEACPYAGATSPDVVYAFTPTQNRTIDINLCAGSAYDTKLYVYENAVTPGAPYACNDDACSTPAFPQPYVSRIDSLNVVGGNTYYIVIDGFGSNAGEYTLDVSGGLIPLPDLCPVESMFSQDPTNPLGNWSIGTSDAGTPQNFLRFEDYAVGDDIAALRWWGFRLVFPWANCTEDPMTFQIKFYPDDGTGAPDVANPASSHERSVAAFDPFIQWSTFDLLRYEVTFDPCVTLQSGWMSIQGTSPPMDCWFLWASSGESGEGSSWLSDNGVLEPVDYDLSICLAACNPVSPRLFLDGPDYSPHEPVTDPTPFDWHELWPLFDRTWDVQSWQDNGNGVLDECDLLNMTNGTTWHVENVTFTAATEETQGGPIEDWIYLDFITPPPSFPVGLWHEMHPIFCRTWECIDWFDNGNGILDFGDFLVVIDPDGEEIFLHVAQVATDIEIVEEIPPEPCPEDINSDGVVNVLDLLAVLAAWGLSGLPEDINNDGTVNVLDLLLVLGAWGPC